jgi:aspartyl-tRNA synthetase
MARLQSVYRTHTCGELRKESINQEVVLSGWVLHKRDHGSVVFLDLRDHYGVTQIVCANELSTIANGIRVESVIKVTGTVVERQAELVNDRIATGQVEVRARSLEILSASQVLPFQIAEDDKAPEHTRLTYRFLELRREKLHANIVLRSRIIKAVREIMLSQGFLEYQTPILTSSSPEGARDFLVPSRFHPGRFFALPQAPQQFKQLLMVAGFDRYFQIAPCFRDEDPRADRSPGEFYQCDMEMSFVEQDDIFAVGEALFHGVFSQFSERTVTPTPFPRITYKDSMEWYGNDKPDLRVSYKLLTVTDCFADTEFRVFREQIDQGGTLCALPVPVIEFPSRKYLDDIVALFTKWTGLGLGYLLVKPEEFKGSIAKFVTEEQVTRLRAKIGQDAPHVVFIAAGPNSAIRSPLGKLRVKVAQDLDTVEKNAFRFCWIVDFPMYEKDLDTGKIDFSHNPFSMPQGGLEVLEQRDPLDIVAHQYDTVCNGHELSSGAIRNHLPAIMYKAFSIAGYSKEDVDKKFGGMIKAFQFGAPPHGGMAPGIDRIVMLLAGEEAIRDVIPFPLAQSVEDLLMGAPSEVSEQQLRDVHIKVVLPETLLKSA